MKFATREDVEMPIAAVFAAVTDFESFERAALRRGATIVHTGNHTEPGVGRGWTARFRYRGRERVLQTRIERHDAPTRLVTSGSVGGLDGSLAIELTALAPRRTRVRVELELKPRTLTARLLVQSLRLGKGSLNNRFRGRVERFARELERRGGKPA